MTLPPVLASAAAPVRQALVIEPGAADPAPRTDALRRDAGAYRDLLRLLGFAVTTLSPATRPELDAGLRGFARAVEPDADVAVFVLGDMRPARGRADPSHRPAPRPTGSKPRVSAWATRSAGRSSAGREPWRW